MGEFPIVSSARRKRFFDIRIIEQWNHLPAEVVRRQTIGSFKLGLDRHLRH